MLSRMLPPSVLLRLQSILGMGSLALLLTVGVSVLNGFSAASQRRITDREPPRRIVEETAFRMGTRGDRPVFVMRRPQYWLETSAARVNSQNRLRARMLGQLNPFAIAVEPDFCQFDTQRQPRELTIKLTRHQKAATRVPGPLLITAVPWNSESNLRAEQEQRVRTQEAGAFGGALIINE